MNVMTWLEIEQESGYRYLIVDQALYLETLSQRLICEEDRFYRTSGIQNTPFDIIEIV